MSVAEKIRPIDRLPVVAAPSTDASSTAIPRPHMPDDGTRQLLRAGFWIVVIGLLALLATLFLFGGIGIYGAHSNAGWLSLMFAMMGLPFGLMLLTLGVAKWLRNRRLSR
jgi:hypothetical protein